MTDLHASHFHRRHHYHTLRYLLPVLLALLLLFLLARPVRGQVWVDSSQLHGQLPSWVDPAYAKPPPQDQPRVIVIEPPIRPLERVWVPAVTETIAERVWIPDRYEYRWMEIVEGDHIVWRRILMLVEAAHWERRCREIVIVPGHWETR